MCNRKFLIHSAKVKERCEREKERERGREKANYLIVFDGCLTRCLLFECESERMNFCHEMILDVRWVIYLHGERGMKETQGHIFKFFLLMSLWFYSPALSSTGEMNGYILNDFKIFIATWTMPLPTISFFLSLLGDFTPKSKEKN